MECGGGSGGGGTSAAEEDDDFETPKILSGRSIASPLPVAHTPSISVPLTSPNGAPANPLQHIITEATQFSTLIKRLKAELALANSQIEEKDRELAEYHEKLEQQNMQLEESKDIMNQQQSKIERLERNLVNGGGGGGDNAMDLKELKSMAAKERQAKAEAEEKLEKYKKSMKDLIGGEFSEFIEELKKDFGEGSKASGGNAAEERLDKLTKFVQDKFGTWTENQVKLKTELGNMKTMVQNLSAILESANLQTSEPQFVVEEEYVDFEEEEVEEEGPRRLRQRSLEPPVLVKQQQQPKTPTKASPSKIPNSQLDHGEDIRKRGRGFYCICGQEYSTKSNLKIHVRTFTEEGQFKCGVCKQRFVLYYMLKRHKHDKHKISTPKGEVGCVDCGKVFSSYLRLYAHRKIAHAKTSTKQAQPQNIAPHSSQFYDEDEEYDSDDIMIIEPEDAEKAVHSPISKSDADQPMPSISHTYSVGVGPSAQSSPQLFPQVKIEVDDPSRKPLLSFSGKRHGMNIAKRYLGFFCICGIQFISRKRLDGHVKFHNSNLPKEASINYAEKDSDEDEEEDDEYIDGQPAPDDGAEENEEGEEEDNFEESYIGDKVHGYHPTKPTTCLCGYVTEIRYNLTKHIKYNTAERKFACESCPLRFVNYSILRRHYLRSHKDVNMWNMMKLGTGCSKCGKIFRNMMEFHKHRKSVHGVMSTVKFKRRLAITSRTSGRRSAPAFRNASGRFVPAPSESSVGDFGPGSSNKHRLSPGHVKKFACSHCPSTYATLHQLRRHKRAAHNIVQKGFAIGCVDCGISFNTRVEHTRHRIEIHHSAIGRKKMKVEETDSQMPNLTPKTETSMRVPTPRTSPQAQPIPIPINHDEIDEEPDYNVGPSSRTPRSQTANPNNEELHQVDKKRKGNGFYCVCGAHFNERKNLSSHIRRKTEQWNFQCKICLRPFFYHAALKRHMMITHKVENVYSNNKTIGCVVCGATFGSWGSLRQHVKVVHNGNGPEEGEDVGEEETTEPNTVRRSTSRDSESSQQSHGVDVEKASEGHYCLCGKNCNSERALVVHVKYQTRERKLQCPKCEKRFICASYLKQHTDRAHKNSGGVAMAVLYRCVRCKATFKTNVELYRHHNNAHKNEGSVNLPRGRRPNASKQVHQALRGNKCSCGKVYTCRGTLKRHLRIQAEGKIYRCDLCSKRFSERGGLNKHLRRIHRRNPYGISGGRY